MDPSTTAQLAVSWWTDFLAAASAHPSTALFAVIAALTSLLLTRSLLIFVVACFLGIAGVIGAEPVADPLKREVFTIGCLIAVALVSLVVVALRLRLRSLRNEVRMARADRAELLAAYEEEASWRMPDD